MNEEERIVRIRMLEYWVRDREMTISNLKRLKDPRYNKTIEGCEEDIRYWKKKIEELRGSA